MTYASANRRPNPAALTAALGIPGAFGALLVVGLAVTVVTKPMLPNPKARDIPDVSLPLPPPPPPEPDAPTQVRNPAVPTTSAPATPDQTTLLPVDLGLGDPTPALPGAGDPGNIGLGTIDIATPTAGPSVSPFDAVGARPLGNPSRWVTNTDYRLRWIKEEMSGAARFTLAIDAGGKVTGCTVTRSTGHAALDAATCDLVSKRARFDPARDDTGKPVAGRYSGTITWQIPE